MLTADETKLAAYAYALRHDEQGQDLWFCPEDLMFVDAVRLWERGYLDRRWHPDELVYRLSDEALTAVELVSVAAAQSPN